MLFSSWLLWLHGIVQRVNNSMYVLMLFFFFFFLPHCDKLHIHATKKFAECQGDSDVCVSCFEAALKKNCCYIIFGISFLSCVKATCTYCK